MDIDNFDFKPLTQGLGFDKKAEETKSTKVTVKAKAEAPAVPTSPKTPIANDVLGIKNKLNLDFEMDDEPISAKGDSDLFDKPIDWNMNPPKTSKSITEMLNALPPSIDFFDEEKAVKQKEAKVYKPIGRIEYTPNSREMVDPVPAADTNKSPNEKIDVSLDNTLEKAFPKVGFRRPFFHQAVEVQPQFTEIPSSFTSAVLDALVISGLTALLLVGLILLTGIDLIAVVMHSKASMGVWLELGAIYGGVYLLYYMCFRGFWGSTLGDWAFDIQLGTAEEQKKWFYPYQVVLRMVGIAATGFVLLPLISMITHKDVAQSYSKLRLYIKNY